MLVGLQLIWDMDLRRESDPDGLLYWRATARLPFLGGIRWQEPAQSLNVHSFGWARYEAVSTSRELATGKLEALLTFSVLKRAEA